jgi:hypothetical protein
MNDDSTFTFLFFLVLGLALAGHALVDFKKWRSQRNLEKAAFALGDTFYETGVPTTTWRRYARTFHDYERLLHALADSGDFSRENVIRYVYSFTGGRLMEQHDSTEYHPERKDPEKRRDDSWLSQSKNDGELGIWGQPSLSGDEGLTNFINNNHD